MRCRILFSLCTDLSMWDVNMEFLPLHNFMLSRTAWRSCVKAFRWLLNLLILLASHPSALFDFFFLEPNLCFWPSWVHFPAEGLCPREALGALAVVTELRPRFSMETFIFVVSVTPAAFHCGGASVRAADRTVWVNCTSVQPSRRSPGLLERVAAAGAWAQRLQPPLRCEASPSNAEQNFQRFYFWVWTFRLFPIATSKPGDDLSEVKLALMWPRGAGLAGGLQETLLSSYLNFSFFQAFISSWKVIRLF